MPTETGLGESIGLVANDLRVQILQALWDHRREHENPVSFSTLRSAVGVSDSGRFNYHLDTLVPEFVRDAEEGYELTYAGRRLVGAAVSGAYTDADVTTEPTPVGDCPSADCGGRQLATYDAGDLVVECDTCETTITDGLMAPPVLLAGHDITDNPDRVGSFLRTRLQGLTQGFCPLCDGPLNSTIVAFDAETAAAGDPATDVLNECRTCGFSGHSLLGLHVADHPAVVSYLHDHGVDYRAPVWEQDWLLAAEATVASEDPPRVELRLGDLDRPEAETLAVTVDQTATVRETERSPSE